MKNELILYAQIGVEKETLNMSNRWPCRFSLLLIAICFIGTALSDISFHLGVFPAPGEKLEHLYVCSDQRLADAVADFLLDQGLYTDELTPLEDEYRSLLRRACKQLRGYLSMELSPCNENDLPRRFVDDRNKFVTLYGSGDKSMKVYLRQGYSSSDLARCACSKFGDCSFNEFEQMEHNIGGFTSVGSTEMEISSLARLAQCGFQPHGVLDVGANVGSWAVAASRVFPYATLLLIEANEAHVAALQRTGYDYEIALVSNSSSEQMSFFRRDGTGDSMFKENTAFYEEIDAVSMRTATIDEIVYKWRTSHPKQHLQEAAAGGKAPAEVQFQLLKMDLQGAELMALQGALQHTLPAVEVIHTEMHIAHYNRGAPSFSQLHSYLDMLGFALYDISDISRTPRDDRMIGIDAVFVRKSSTLWAPECTGFPLRQEYTQPTN